MAVRVLVVDDSRTFRAMLTDMLRGLGCVVVGEAADGEEAVARFTELRPSLVLLDVEMPNANGLSALMRIRAVDPRAVVIMCSVLESNSILEACLVNGAADYIRKDRMDEAPARLRRYLL
ncbi:MAG: response regulator [Pseudomonadota bacterium]